MKWLISRHAAERFRRYARSLWSWQLTLDEAKKCLLDFVSCQDNISPLNDARVPDFSGKAVRNPGSEYFFGDVGEPGRQETIVLVTVRTAWKAVLVKTCMPLVKFLAVPKRKKAKGYQRPKEKNRWRREALAPKEE